MFKVNKKTLKFAVIESRYLTRTGGRSPIPFFKTKINYFEFWEKDAQTMFIYGLYFHLKCYFKSI